MFDIRVFMRKLIYIILIGLLCHSCRVIEVVSIDYLLPAQVSYPDEVKSVLVVDNTFQEENVPEGKKQARHSSIPDFGWLECDKKLVINELAQGLADANYFDEVVVCDSALRGNDYMARETKLSQLEVQTLANDFMVDMIISLEKARILIKEGVIALTDMQNGNPNYLIDAVVFTQTRLYLPHREEPFVSFGNKDSIYWINYAKNMGDAAIKEGSAFAGTLPISDLVPVWKTGDRYYYAGGSVNMRDAAVCVRNNEWDEAYSLWKEEYGRKKGKAKMRIAVNIALYHEMRDELDKAEEWIKIADELAGGVQSLVDAKMELTEDQSLIRYYLYHLTLRNMNKEKLNLQMKRFTS